MTKIDDIEKAISALSAKEIARLREFIDGLDGRLFDERIERHAKAGKLDWLADEAMAHHKAGRSRNQFGFQRFCAPCVGWGTR